MGITLSPRLCKEVTTRFYEILESGRFSYSADLISSKFKVSSQTCLWASWEQFCTPELISIVNGFIHEFSKLQALDEIIKDYDEKEQIALRYELTRVPFDFCLRQPNEYRNRIIYLVSHLCHRANLETDKKYKDSLPDDKKIGYKTLEKVARPWSSSASLISALDSVGNKNTEFRDITDDYRDKVNHRQPPSLEVGLKVSLKRIRGDELSSDQGFQSHLRRIGEDIPKVIYTPHVVKPLQTSKTLPILVRQADFMKDVFSKYWDLVLEQASALSS